MPHPAITTELHLRVFSRPETTCVPIPDGCYSLDGPWDALCTTPGAVCVPDGHVIKLEAPHRASEFASKELTRELARRMQGQASCPWDLATSVNGDDEALVAFGDQHLAQLADDFHGVPALRSLDVQYTHVSDAGLVHLAKLTNLEHLRLADTAVCGRGFADLKPLGNLRSLGLHQTVLSADCMADLGELLSLEALDLTFTHDAGGGLARLCDLANLRALFLTGSGAGDADVAHLAGLAKLEALGLEYCGITDKGVAHLAGITSLTDLDLEGNYAVTDAALGHLAGLSNLKCLSLDSEEITEAAINVLRQKLPQCDIFAS